MDGLDYSASGSGYLPIDGENTTKECYLYFESTELKIQAAVRASIGLLSFLCCVGVIIVMVVFKKYRVFLQRLILYLAISAAIHSISYSLARVNFYTARPILDPYCYFGGFFNHYTSAVELISIWCITISLFFKAMFKKNTHKLELVYILATYLGPALWFWVPLWKQSYGTSAGWCGIRFLNEDCSRYTEGTAIAFGIWYIPLYISLTIIFIAMVIVAIKSVRDVYVWSGQYDPNEKKSKETLRNEIRQLVWYPIIYLVLNSFSLVSQIYRAVHPNDPSGFLTYLRVITSPLRGAVIAIVFALDKDTRSRLTPTHCRARCHECYHGDKVEEYETTVGFSDSYAPFNDDQQLLNNSITSKKESLRV